jgi:hypothetical protein
MHQRRPAPAPRAKPSAVICSTASKSARARSHAPRAAHEGEEIVLAVLRARRFGDDLLRQDVERRVVRDDAIELAAPHRPHQRRALDQIVARRGEDASLRQTRNRMAGSADALQQRRDAMRRSNLADEIDVADVDTELQRRGGDERLQPAVLQPILASSRRSFDRLP